MNLDLTRPEVKSALIDRINRLTAESQARWGKMNAAQMLAHCQAQMRVALGDEVLKHSIMGKIFGSWARKKVLEGKPYAHNLPTAPSFRILNLPDFAQSQKGLIEMIGRFNRDQITKEPHPFFGRMTVEEWAKGTWKHLDHHLCQFGV
jgi:hypothetical protein